MRALLFTLFWAACAATPAATVYKWVDDNGVIHYSDQPHENAQKVELKAPQTYSAPKIPNTPVRRSSSTPGKQPAAYQSCAVSEPTPDQVFMNTDTVVAGVTATPPIRPGDKAVVTLDGMQVPGVPASGGQFTISPVDRGTHSIQVAIQDSSGANVCTSAAVTFHVHQPSIQSPTSPIKPH
jgi:hypothetical protein